MPSAICRIPRRNTLVKPTALVHLWTLLHHSPPEETKEAVGLHIVQLIERLLFIPMLRNDTDVAIAWNQAVHQGTLRSGFRGGFRE